MEEQRVHRVAKGRRAVVLVVSRSIGVADRRGLTSFKVGDRCELVLAVGDLNEQVEYILFFTLEAAREAMTKAGVPVADQAILGRIDRQGVGVTRTFRPEADRATNAGAVAELVVQVNLHGGEIIARQAVRDVFDFLARNRELGREGVAPIRKELGLVGRQVLIDLIGRRQQTHADVHAIGDCIVQTQVAALGLLIRENCAVLVVDIPVDLAEILLVLNGQGGGRPIKRIIAVDALGDVADLIDFGLRDARHFVHSARALRTRQDRLGRFILLVIEQEEQAILDDRTA
ncbi:hypothetical protein D3C72_665300 [compost metagenome]